MACNRSLNAEQAIKDNIIDGIGLNLYDYLEDVMEDRELDKWLAENVMGWEKVGEYCCTDNITFYHKVILVADWNPTANIAQAMEYVEKLDARMCLTRGRKGNYMCELYELEIQEDNSVKVGKLIGIKNADTPERALCQAIKKAIGDI